MTVREAHYSRSETLGAALAGVNRLLAGEHRESERALRAADVPFTDPQTLQCCSV